MMLAIASPFLKQLFQNETEACLSSGYSEPTTLYLPDVKSALVQALIHLVYTGKVVTQEGQFYSLMKLVYALNINASIEAESTVDLPTEFHTLVSRGHQSLLSGTSLTCDTCRISKKRKLDIDCENNILNSVSFNKIKDNLVVNSLTASGVVIKEEFEEKHNILSELVEKQNFQLDGKPLEEIHDVKSDYNSLLSEEKHGTEHFVSVEPNYQIKMEIPGQVSTSLNTPTTTTTSSRSNMENTSTSTSNVNNEPSNPDDPLAAIMNQTIFGGKLIIVYEIIIISTALQYPNHYCLIFELKH